MAGRGPNRKTKPTTVRLRAGLDLWVREQGQLHPQGQSGVVNDAIEFYKAHKENRREQLFNTITGDEQAKKEPG